MAHTLSREAETFLEQAQFVTVNAIREKTSNRPCAGRRLRLVVR
jgi:hypothetical protein